MTEWILSSDETSLINLKKIETIQLFKLEVRAYFSKDPDDYIVIFEGQEPGDADDFYISLCKKLKKQTKDAE